MEAQLHRNHRQGYDDPLHSADFHGDDEETRSTMKKVKDKVHRLKDTLIKHGHHDHAGEHRDEAQTINDSHVVRSGLAEPTVMGTPVLAEDLYATHSVILDTPVRSFARWEEEERRGSPPPLSTNYETHSDHQPHQTYGQDVSTLEGGIGNPPDYTGSYGARLTDDWGQAHVGGHAFGDRDVDIGQPMTGVEKGEKEVGITEVLKSFQKMNVYDEPHTTTLASDQNENELKVYTGSHDDHVYDKVPDTTPLAFDQNENEPKGYTGSHDDHVYDKPDTSPLAFDQNENEPKGYTGSHDDHVYDKPDTSPLAFDQNEKEPKVYTGSHDDHVYDKPDTNPLAFDQNEKEPKVYAGSHDDHVYDKPDTTPLAFDQNENKPKVYAGSHDNHVYDKFASDQNENEPKVYSGSYDQAHDNPDTTGSIDHAYDKPDTTSLGSNQNENEPQVYTGSHDQFASQPVESPPLGTIAANPSNPNSSYSQRISSVTSAIADKASAVKDSIVSKLSPSGEKKNRSSFPTDFSHKVADTLSGTLGPVYEKVSEAGSSVMSKIPHGAGHDESSASVAGEQGRVKEYLADRFKPGEDDKVLSEAITNALHMGKRQQTTTVQETSTIIHVVRDDEGERRLQESSN